MSKIRVLPEQLANRIAAGEVVERPASVVKELIENSLDAGATRIEVEIEGGGTRLIRVIDNGEGMVEDDVLLCLERHGTSKITEDHDLEAISSLGFRGEAIPSISSVSRMTITSRHQSEEFGTTAILNYGKLFKIHESGCSRGTIIEIRNLFGNTPARKKFLRTKRTEIGHIDEIVKNYALAAPEVSFLLRIDDRQTLLLDSEQDLAQRLAGILHYSGDFIEIKSATGKTLPRLSGFLIPPDAQVKGSTRIKLLVNGRSVRDRMLSHGVTEGLRGFLMKGRNPAGLLHLHIDPTEVDVNVHPTKQEVRFRASRDVHQLIVQAIQDAMQGYQSTLRNAFFEAKETITPIARTITTPSPIKPTATYTTTTAEPVPTATAKPAQPVTQPAKAPEPEAQQPVFVKEHQKGHGLKIVGQFNNLYIFCQSPEGLIVIDQHAAHERLLFEKLKKQFLQGSISSQNLMFPETVELSLADSHKVEQYADSLEKMGFSIRDFGDNAYVISAVPALGSHISPSDLFLDVLEQFGATQSNKSNGSFQENILASMACKSAVKAGDRLSHEEIEALLNNMARADLFSHCPHGRPVLKQFSDADIKKWFHRT
jgi:DNA mismatch repair protein MutL